MSNINELVRLAAISKKPGKRDAQILVRELADALPAEIWREHGESLAQLYTFFMPPKPKTARTAFEWVALAAAGPKEFSRPFLAYVMVEPHRIYATDGHRMHVAPNDDGLAPGAYLPNGDFFATRDEFTSDVGHYPEIDRVIPSAHEWRQEVDLDELPIGEVRGTVCREVPGGTWTGFFNRKYFDEAAQGMGKLCLQSKGHESAMLLTSINSADGRFAVIMPIRA